MNNLNLKQQYLRRDRLLRVLSKDGFFRATIVKNTKSAQIAALNHNISSNIACILAEAMTSVSLLASFLKGEERINIVLNSNGLITKLFAEALQTGEVKGFVTYSPEIKDNIVHRDSDLFKDGSLAVSKILYNRTEPLSGIIELIPGSLSENLYDYFRSSEQIPTLIGLFAINGEDGNILQSGGYILQSLPGASQIKFAEFENSLKSHNDEFIGLLENENNLAAILSTILPFEFEVIKSSPVDFFCRCSKQGFMNRLMTLGIDEIRNIRSEGQNELVCQYCNKHYYLTDDDFEQLINEMTALSN